MEEHSVAVRQYSFHHMTVQEFLVALLLVEQTGDSEEKLRATLEKLEMGPHQFVVIQFLAGLLPARLLPVLFSFLNTFLHHNWDEAECGVCGSTETLSAVRERGLRRREDVSSHLTTP